MVAAKSRNYIPQADTAVKPLTKAELNALVSLKKKKGRRSEGLYLAEGVRLLEEALKCKLKPKRLFYYEPELSERGSAALAAFRARKVETQTLSSRDFHRLADTEHPQGLIGVFSLPQIKFSLSRISGARRMLILENLSDPGNVGAIIRSAVGFGFDPILLLGDCVEPFNPKLVRSTAGAIFSTRLMEIEVSDLLQIRQKAGAKILVTDLSGEVEGNWAKAEDALIVLAIGSESEGASAELLDQADQSIRISHSGQIESLNAATAAAIAMHQLYIADSAGGGAKAKASPPKPKKTRSSAKSRPAK